MKTVELTFISIFVSSCSATSTFSVLSNHTLRSQVEIVSLELILHRFDKI